MRAEPVRVWDLVAGREQAVLAGHRRQVFAVALTPDGTRAVSGGEDASVRVWDLVTHAQIACWTADHPVVGCAVLSSQPLRVGVGQAQGPPVLLELRGTPQPPGDRQPGGRVRRSRGQDPPGQG